MEKLESSLMKKHGKKLKELRQEYERLYDDRAVSKIALDTDNKGLKNQVKKLESVNATLEKSLRTQETRSNSEKIAELQRELEHGKAANANLEKRHAEGRAAGVLAARATEDNLKKMSLKRGDANERNNSTLVEIEVEQRTKQLKDENQTLKKTIIDLETTKTEDERAAKKFADKRVAECKTKYETDNKVLKDRITQFGALQGAIAALSQTN